MGFGDLEPFAIEVERRDHVTIVRPRGELDFATVEALRAALDAAVAETLRAARDGFERPARLLVDLSRLSFIDSTAVHLLVALDERARRDGFELTLLAPAAPIDRVIRVCGLDQVLPFAAPDDAVATEPGESLPADRGGEALRDAS
jgi:anti-sigma B factor antagonist